MSQLNQAPRDEATRYVVYVDIVRVVPGERADDMFSVKTKTTSPQKAITQAIQQLQTARGDHDE